MVIHADMLLTKDLTRFVESIDRIEEQRKILSEIMDKENDKWSKTIESIKTLFALAVNRITSVYESVNKDRSRTVSNNRSESV